MKAATNAIRSERPLWRAVAVAPAAALVTLAAALIATHAAGVPLRDPKHVTATRLIVTVALVSVLLAVDVLARAARARGGLRPPSRAALRAVASERLTPVRLGAVAVAVLAFFATYLAYRNLKSVVPLLRPDALFDRQLTDIDRSIFFGHDPAALLHGLFGTGVSAHVLSAVYMFFFAFIPIAIASALAFTREIRKGVLFTTALALNWAIGATTYFMLPSIGPFDGDRAEFTDLPHTAVTQMQAMLMGERTGFLHDAAGAGAAQSIGAFASLHTSIYVTAALAAHLLGFPRIVKIAIWTLTALTVIATVYFGWHYVLDDLAGVAIALVALALARLLTGVSRRAAERPAVVSAPAVAEAA